MKLNEGRCGCGPRIPIIVIAPYAKHDFFDHTLVDQISTLRFIEANWQTGPIGDGCFDELAGSLDDMFDFSQQNFGEGRLIL